MYISGMGDRFKVKVVSWAAVRDEYSDKNTTQVWVIAGVHGNLRLKGTVRGDNR